MANTLNDLYLKFFEANAPKIEKDRYFQYLFALSQAGERTISQSKKILHKVVDEEWLTMIEDCMDALNEVTDNPRRFVTTREEVVPVSLAKRISAESVMHLTQNTQFIAEVKNGEVRPSMILNISSEDSINLYENRFVYHLIQRLVTFIDKRTDIIFWSTGDETLDALTMQSRIDDAYEVIDYKLELRVKNVQSPVKNDSDNMQTFMRIDHVRRMVTRLRNSSFCTILSGCQQVHSPIQRTNLMMKDPYYRKCYQLWQFLEDYDKVGYTIEETDRPLEFDEEYLNQLQTGMIANYSLFKSILGADERNINEKEKAPKRRRTIKPKFLKKIQELIVNDYDIEDVEIRKVIIEEVTQAQLDAEAKLATETQRADTAEENYRKASAKAEDAIRRMQIAEEQSAVAEAAMQQALKDKDTAERTVARVVQETKVSIEASEKARLEAERQSEENLNARRDMEVSLREAKELRKNAEEARAKMEEERDAAEKQMLADRTLRETAQKREVEAIRSRDETAQKNEELTRESKRVQELYQVEAANRKLAEESRDEAQSRIDGALEKQKEAENIRAQAEADAKQSKENARSFERRKNEAEYRLKAALETINKANQDYKAIQQTAQKDREAREAADRENRDALRLRDEALASQSELLDQIAELQRQLEQERTARIEAQKYAQENSLLYRFRNMGGRHSNDQ